MGKSKSRKNRSSVRKREKLNEAIPSSDAGFSELDDEEFAAEVNPTPELPVYTRDREGENSYTGTGTTLGWVSLVVAVASLFVLPVLLGPGAVVLGYFSYQSGSRRLGITSIAIGFIALITFLITAPFYR